MPKIVKIFLFGSQGSGKTELLNKLIPSNNSKSPSKSTTGADFVRIACDDYELQIWDTGAELQFTIAPGTNLALYCVDLSKPLIQGQVKNDLSDFKHVTFNDNPKIILVGTKSDSESQVSDEQFEELFQQIKLSQQFNCEQRIQVSSKENKNIAELLRLIYDEVAEIYPRSNNSKPGFFFINNQSSKPQQSVPWQMSFCELFAWFCFPLVGWAYLAYYLISTSSCCNTTEAAETESPESGTLSCG